jgi:alcohol dehydrogenase
VTAQTSVLSLRRRGRHVQVGLLLGEHAMTALPMARVIGWELEIYGSHGMQAHRYAAMLDMVTSGALAPEKLVGRRISLDDGIAALTGMDRFEGLGATVITSF